VAWSYVACMAAVGGALVVRVLASLRRPPVVPEKVEMPVATAPAAMGVPSERPQKTPVPAAAAPRAVNAPVSLAEARRRYREAG
jgi:hypothetical protein